MGRPVKDVIKFVERMVIIFKGLYIKPVNVILVVIYLEWKISANISKTFDIQMSIEGKE